MAEFNSLKTLLKAIIQTELELFTINIQLSHHAKMGFILRH
ncbi:hypothetical protein L935_08995 [Helicobacter pylori PZ5086]|nr:hypothetical protein L935_08995 [Helicobacter pylori PZ5086]